jgi:glucan phosphoethanolaminetransferase (alkaline phosphatase superfamily)
MGHDVVEFGTPMSEESAISSPQQHLAKWPVLIAISSIIFVHLPALLGPWWVASFDKRPGLYWSLIFLFLSFAVLGNLKRVAWLSLLCIPLSVFELYVIKRLQIQSEENTYSFIVESNLSEALDAIGLGTLLLVFMALIALVVLVFLAIKRVPGDLFALRTRVRVILVLLIVPLMLLELGARPKAIHQFGQQSVTSAGALIEGEVHTATKVFMPSFPYGMPLRLYKFAKSRLAIKSRADRLNTFSFGLSERAGATQDLVVIAFIGESSGRMNWEIFGGTPETNPLLKKRTDLVKLPDVLATYNVTRLSVPLILNRKDPRDYRVFLQEGSVIQAFEELGFETHWVSNQQIVGPHDSPISLIAYQADHQHFLNASIFESPNQYDVGLADQMNLIIQKPGPKFIVLHGLGSHARYESRYPPEFTYFPTNTDNADTNTINAYNNTIRFTDFVLFAAIQRLELSKRKVAFLYVSDHGENMPSSECQLKNHDQNTIYTSSVPAFLWFSKEYRDAFPQAVSAAEKNASRKIGFSVWFETLLEMGGHPNLPINRHAGLLSDNFVSPQRWVMEMNAAMRDVDKNPTADKCGFWAPTPDALPYSKNPLR